LAVGQDHVVLVAGSFNHWVPEPMQWNEAQGVWEKKMALGAGKWAYKFVVDGEWIMDPACETYEKTEYGAVNSVIEVGVTQV
jgi:1,4-alpha-glucan branching enzyme